MSEVALIQDSDIDFDKYLRTPPEAAKTLPASGFADEVVREFLMPEEQKGAYLPWVKSHQVVRIRPAEFSMWGGVNGHGKSMMLNYVLLALIAQGEKACICSFEMKPKQTLKRMARQFMGSPDPTVEYIKNFHNWLHDKLWLYDQTGGIRSDRMVAVARYCVMELGINHLVIDSLMKCGIADDDYKKQKDFADELQNIAKDTGLHIHLVHHSRKGETENKIMDKFDFKGSGGITDLADNVFIVWKNKKKEKLREERTRAGERLTPEEEKKPDAILVVDKQRHGEWEGRLSFWTDTKSFQFKPKMNSPTMNEQDWMEKRWS